MLQPELKQKVPHWKRAVSFCLLLAFFSFLVAASFIISGLLLDPAIPAADKQDLLFLVISRFDQVFNDSIVLALFLALAVMLLEPLKVARLRLSRSGSNS